MRFLKRFFVLFIIFGALWYFYGDDYQEDGVSGVFEEVQTDFHDFRTHPVVVRITESVNQGIYFISERISDVTGGNEPDPGLERPDLQEPSMHAFSVHNIELGDSKEEVEAEVGEPERVTLNEYGANWHAYHENYQHFFMVSYDESDHVNGMYTNQDVLTAASDITFASTRDEVLEVLPDPLESMRKGLVQYQVQNNGEYHIFKIDGSYVTTFYDLHEETKLSAILIMDEGLERQKQSYFGTPSEELRTGLEYQLFDLTNAVRVKHGLSVLAWEEEARGTVRAHSEDMAENNYFNHTNLDGESPFDRLNADGISYQSAGENLAARQPSSIFAHEGLMNSPGHRENKLLPRFNALVVGVSFDDEQPFYTENYLSR